MPELFYFFAVLLGKTRLSGIILTWVTHAHSWSGSFRGQSQFPVFLWSLLTSYTFWGDHSSTQIWCCAHRVIPLARGLTLHITFVFLKTLQIYSKIYVNGIFQPCCPSCGWLKWAVGFVCCFHTAVHVPARMCRCRAGACSRRDTHPWLCPAPAAACLNEKQ